MYSIGQLSEKYNLSRSSLLYYDSIGLLKPSDRTSSNYRIYSKKDIKRLEQILLYREAGVSLDDIKNILDNPHITTDDILLKRLTTLNSEIKLLHLQQQIIVHLLKNKQLSTDMGIINKDSFVEILKNAGLGENEMNRLHMKFEELYPNEHQTFLELLGIPKEEIRLIREYSKTQDSFTLTP